MKFLLDACVSSRTLTTYLSDHGHGLSAVTLEPRASDETLLNLSRDDGRILVTADKDFGELVFVRGLPHGPVIRFVDLAVADQAIAISDLLEHHATDLAGQVFVTVTRGRIRIRRRP